MYTNLSEWQTRQIKGNKKIREVTFVSERDGKTGVLILLKSDISSKSVLRDIENRIGLQAGQIHWNIPYLDAADVGIEVILQMICVFAGLLLSAAIVIYNIFNIYVLQDIRLLVQCGPPGLRAGS